MTNERGVWLMSYNHSYATMSIQSIHHCWVVNDNPHHQTTNITSSCRRNRDTLSTLSVCAWLQMKLFGIFLFPLLRHKIFSEWSHEPADSHNQPEKEFWKYLSCFVLSVGNPAINVRIFKLKKSMYQNVSRLGLYICLSITSLYVSLEESCFLLCKTSTKK